MTGEAHDFILKYQLNSKGLEKLQLSFYNTISTVNDKRSSQHSERDNFTSTHQRKETVTSTVRNIILAGRNNNTGNK